MPVVPFSLSVPLNGQIDVPLAPYDRLGGRGGRVAVAATLPILTPTGVTMTVMLGSDVVQSEGALFGEGVAGQGPTSETPRVVGVGAPGDPITVRLTNSTAGNIITSGVVQIDNA